jgi:hypothetical protein
MAIADLRSRFRISNPEEQDLFAALKIMLSGFAKKIKYTLLIQGVKATRRI